jgi:hypothetical protein
MENIYEQFFFLKYSGGWSFTEAYNLPVGLRTWFTKRLVEQIEKENAAMEEASKGSGGGSRTQTLSAHNQPPPPQTYSKKYGQD